MWKRLDESVSLSEKLASLSWPALGTWMYLVAQTDTMGRFPRDARVVKAKCMTMRYDVRLESVEEALLEIERAGLLHRYDANGKAYLVLHNAPRYNPPGALGNVSPKYPEPSASLCECLTGRRENGVRTPDVISSHVSSSSSPPEEPINPTSPEAQLIRIMEDQRIIAKPDTMRRYATGWISDKGFEYAQTAVMDKASRGKDILTVHDRFFRVNGNGKRQAPPIRQKKADPGCQKCGGSGRRQNPTTGGTMDCACVR